MLGCIISNYFPVRLLLLPERTLKKNSFSYPFISVAREGRTEAVKRIGASRFRKGIIHILEAMIPFLKYLGVVFRDACLEKRNSTS